MRLTSIAAIGLVILSTAALAQVGRTPVEPKSVPYDNMVPANAAVSNEAANNVATTNVAPPASPGTKTEPATPPR